MIEEWSMSWMWWTTAIEAPVLGCMFWLIHHGRRESERESEDSRQEDSDTHLSIAPDAGWEAQADRGFKGADCHPCQPSAGRVYPPAVLP